MESYYYYYVHVSKFSVAASVSSEVSAWSCTGRSSFESMT